MDVVQPVIMALKDLSSSVVPLCFKALIFMSVCCDFSSRPPRLSRHSTHLIWWSPRRWVDFLPDLVSMQPPVTACISTEWMFHRYQPEELTQNDKACNLYATLVLQMRVNQRQSTAQSNTGKYATQRNKYKSKYCSQKKEEEEAHGIVTCEDGTACFDMQK